GSTGGRRSAERGGARTPGRGGRPTWRQPAGSNTSRSRRPRFSRVNAACWSDEKGSAARRRPKSAREAYFLYVERADEGANEADEPLSALSRRSGDRSAEVVPHRCLAGVERQRFPKRGDRGRVSSGAQVQQTEIGARVGHARRETAGLAERRLRLGVSRWTLIGDRDAQAVPRRRVLR